MVEQLSLMFDGFKLKMLHFCASFWESDYIELHRQFVYCFVFYSIKAVLILHHLFVAAKEDGSFPCVTQSANLQIQHWAS